MPLHSFDVQMLGNQSFPNSPLDGTRSLLGSWTMTSEKAAGDTSWNQLAWNLVEQVQTTSLPRLPLVLMIPILCLLLPIVSFVVYQLYFHPLAKYPGPFWGKLTGLRAAYHAWLGDIHLDMYECHQRYGPHVRFSPNYLLFNTTEAVKDIYGHGKNLQKSMPYLAMVHGAPSTFTLIDKKEHAWKKRILSQKFSEASIRGFEPAMLELMDRFCEHLLPLPDPQAADALLKEELHGWSEPLDMSSRCDHLFFDLITTFVFGENFDLIRSSWYHHIPEALTKSNERISVIVQFPLVVYRRLDKMLFRSSVAGRKDFLRFVHNLVTHRMKCGKRNDVFSSLTNATDPETGKKLSREEIVAESILMLVAGSDTSATGLASLFFYLSRNHDKREKLTKEIRSAFSSLDDVRFGPKLNACRYLHACVSECLRLTPPVAATPFREVSKGGAVVDGQFIPEGTNIGTGLYSIQHNDRYFENPYEFKPERWLKDEQTGLRHNTDANLPFMVGPRACLGKSLATVQSAVAMARVCWSMDFTVADSMKEVGAGKVDGPKGRRRADEYQLIDHITVARDGPYVSFRRRQD